jgi:hypothetical protein
MIFLSECLIFAFDKKIIIKMSTSQRLYDLVSTTLDFSFRLIYQWIVLRKTSGRIYKAGYLFSQNHIKASYL